MGSSAGYFQRISNGNTRHCCAAVTVRTRKLRSFLFSVAYQEANCSSQKMTSILGDVVAQQTFVPFLLRRGIWHEVHCAVNSDPARRSTFHARELPFPSSPSGPQIDHARPAQRIMDARIFPRERGVPGLGSEALGWLGNSQ